MRGETPGNPLDFDVVVPLPETGALFGERYRVVDVRRGGMGEVFIVRTLGDDRKQDLALKSFQKHLFFVRESRHAFVREVAVWMRLTGEPHIMPALGLEYLEGRPFVRMPAVGTTVRELLRSGPLEAEDAATVAFQTALAMRCAERRLSGLVHGDLKPENLLVSTAGVMVSDFGLARAAATSQPFMQQETTWAYRAPESWAEGGHLSPASDVYAFGIVLYELITGSRPFDADGREAWAAAHREVPPPPLDFETTRIEAALATIASSCLEKDPSRRPTSFTAIFNELNERLVNINAGLSMILVDRGFNAKEQFSKVGEEIRDTLVADLVRMGELELALDELASRSPEERTVRSAIAHGDVLSLLGHDEEALEKLEEAARAPEATDEERWTATKLRALTLKRLERYDEAIKILERLRSEVSDEVVLDVVVNLATVHLDRGDPGDAAAIVSLLQPLAPGYPDQAELWANLGLAYEQLGDFDASVRALKRAIVAAPHMAELQVHLARMLMEHFGAIGEAAVALQLAFQQGFESREWLVRTRACSVLLGDQDNADALAAQAKRSLPPHIVAAMDAELEDVLARLRGRLSSGD